METEIKDLRFPEYIKVEGKLGEGAFGAVFKAHHEALDIPVAVKILHVATSREIHRRKFKTEARAMARMDHPNVIRIFEYRELEAGDLMVMEWMDGGSLLELSGSAGITNDFLVRMALGLASGLQALHLTKILHRDIKPGNILIRKADSRIKIADLGLAWSRDTLHSVERGVMGTLPFLAPEILDRGPEYTESTDVYALGVSLYQIWCGSLPFAEAGKGNLIIQIVKGEKRPIEDLRPGLDRKMKSLIDAMMFMDPADRIRLPDLLRELQGGSGGALSSRPSESPGGFGPSSPRITNSAVRRVGSWVVGEMITEGYGNWTTYAAHHGESLRPARIHFLKKKSELTREKVLASAKAAYAWGVGGVVQVLDWGMAGGDAYVVTEYVGRSLYSIVREGGPLGEMEALSIGMAVAEALKGIHDAGYVYQMVEPHGISVSENGSGYLLAWPLHAREDGSPSIDENGRDNRIFKAAFAAPEYNSTRIPIRKNRDVFGLGSTLYFVATAKPPFLGPVILDAGSSRPKVDVPPVRQAASTLTGPFADLIDRMVSIDPEARPSDMGRVSVELKRIYGLLSCSTGKGPVMGTLDV